MQRENMTAYFVIGSHFLQHLPCYESRSKVTLVRLSLFFFLIFLCLRLNSGLINEESNVLVVRLNVGRKSPYRKQFQVVMPK